MLDPSTLVRGRDLWELIDARVAATPDHEMACDERGRRITYAEFRQRCRGGRGGHRRARHRRRRRRELELAHRLRRARALGRARSPRRRAEPDHPDLPRAGGRLLHRSRPAPSCSSCPACGAASTTRRWRAAIAADDARRSTCSWSTRPRPVGLPDGDPATLPPRAAPPVTAADGRCAGTSTRRAPPPTRRAHGTPTSRVDHVGRRDGRAARLAPTTTAPASRSRSPTSAASRWLFVCCSGGACSCSSRLRPAAHAAVLAREDVTIAGSGTPFHMAYLAAQRGQPDVPLFPHLKSCTGGGRPSRRSSTTR